MASRLQDRLSVARRERFVGRAGERAVYESAVASPELPFHLLFVFGPGGIGKTSLLGQFRRASEEAGIPVAFVDARQVEPSPESFVAALQMSMGLTPSESPLQAMAGGSNRCVLLVDTYEMLSPLDTWLREVFLPQVPENTLIVLAGREPLTTAWRTDPGWQGMVQILPLRNLSPEESRTYLEMRSVPADQHQAILEFTRGHPLALSLVAEVFAQRRDIRFQPEDAPDIIKTLLEQFVQKVPGPAHRAALEACALVRVTTEGLLANMLNFPDVHELFDWLRSLSFVEARRDGLFPHDLAREALAADLRWRNPDWYAELHRRARQFYLDRIHQAQPAEQQRLLMDLIYLHRDNAVVRPAFEWQESGTMLADSARASDFPALAQMVAEHEGPEAARLAQYWFGRQPRNVLVVRDPQRQPVGFMQLVSLQQASTGDLTTCVAARVAWEYLERCAPLRAGEGATLFRFWMARDSYQAVSAVQSLLFINAVRHYLTAPGLAFTFFPCADPDFWAPVFAYADLVRIPEADFEVGGRHYGVFGHDWRMVPPASWLSLMGEREVAAAAEVAAPPQIHEALVVLSQSEFADAIRDALKDFSRLDALRANPLVRSRLLVGRNVGAATGLDRGVALQMLIREAIESLQGAPKESKYFRALSQTYLHPATTQEAAAELLDLPFSTYRRHLKEGIGRVTEVLWQREIAGV